METTYNTTTFHHHQQQQLPPPQDLTTTNITKELMFEKPLTPSDVGKLNRLVIPKQHAERYFPLDGTDTVAQRKGLVLSFEDESGKLWRFRYSYWNSSQSYVLTKGWSRYVKEKHLDAGDVVLFQRHLLDCDRMFIGWRRRRFAAVSGRDTTVAETVAPPVDSGAQVNEIVYGGQSSYPSHHLPYQQECNHAEEMYENVDTYQRGEVATRRLRLFGVNLECQDNPEPSDPYGSSHSGQSDHRYNSGSNNSHHHMMRYHQHQG